jgi:hypothetical protein
MLGWKNQTTNNNNTQLDKHITMSLPNQIIVSGATNFADANGTYTKGADINGFAAWYKENAKINAGLASQWIITPLEGSTEYYRTANDSAINFPNPANATWIMPWGAPAEITVTAVAAAPSTVTSFKVAEGAKVKLQGKVKVV